MFKQLIWVKYDENIIIDRHINYEMNILFNGWYSESKNYCITSVYVGWIEISEFYLLQTYYIKLYGFNGQRWAKGGGGQR